MRWELSLHFWNRCWSIKLSDTCFFINQNEGSGFNSTWTLLGWPTQPCPLLREESILPRMLDILKLFFSAVWPCLCTNWFAQCQEILGQRGRPGSCNGSTREGRFADSSYKGPQEALVAVFPKLGFLRHAIILPKVSLYIYMFLLLTIKPHTHTMIHW